MLTLEHKPEYWLTDSRKVMYLHQADQHWMYSKMRPLLKGGKLHRMALVLQPETLIMTEQGPLHDTTTTSFRGKKLLDMDFFLDVESALNWLQDFAASFLMVKENQQYFVLLDTKFQRSY